MITGPLKSKIDKLWEEFWVGGVTNPLTVIEQITFLMYARLLDINETSDEKKEERTKQPFKRRFGPDQQHLRWSKLRHIESAEKLLTVVRDELFPFFKTTTGAGSLFANYMKDAQLMVQKPALMRKAVDMISELPLHQNDVKGDLYEYLLSKLTTAGIAGQFRTPRHIIRAMIDIMDPVATDRICDPAVGTAGFLTGAYEFMVEKYSSEHGTIREQVKGNDGQITESVIYTGDQLGSKNRQHIDHDMFHGFDFDATMLRIAAMNLVMHGIAEPDIHDQDTLSQGFCDRHPTAARNAFDLVLANPPFKGVIDEDDTDPELLRAVRTKKTELLFIAVILRMLKVGGRAAVIVPDGVLFGSSKAHTQLRSTLINDNQLEAVISLPSGVFKPYAGVSTAIIVFTKGGVTDNVWFYDLLQDGFSLDDKRTQQTDKNDIPDLVSQWQQYRDARNAGQTLDAWQDKAQKAFMVDKQSIIDNKFDLSLNRYQDKPYKEEIFEDPKVLLTQLMALEEDIQADLKVLEGML